ncbi:AMP-binding protein [Kutzneria viridogrisea]|uniref:Fatty acid CoA ligase n=2 Tax=Kutzneria TaxID=43356 RepID=W5WM47_9PSEU|nr:AMP-binding protein [Kutzneria albida]AHH99234.1 hypothetical protein KALB_5873 [Kutzneria albida DSM 43870]MBA8923212.1 fatty-acyl-CoA synthase [Kutzneria viridogrisea]
MTSSTAGATGSANYVETILRGLSRDSDHIAFHLEDGSTISHGEFGELVHRIAHTLSDHGIRSGSTVALLSANRPEILATRYAANLLGARIVYLYEGLAVEVQSAIVSDVDTDILVADNRLAARAAEIVAEVPVKALLTLGPASTGSDLLALAAAADSSPVPPHPVAPGDTWSVRHTGGTTGHPKGILMPSGGYRAMLEHQATAQGADVVYLISTTLAHGAGNLADGVFAAGGTIVLHERFAPAQVLADIERHRVTDLFLLPPLLYRVLDDPASASTDTSSLRRFLYFGCAASPTRIGQALDRFGPILFQIYGQSEAGGISMLTEADHQRPELLDSVGRPIPGVEVAIRDEQGNDLPVGQTGEICVRSAMTSAGYWRNPELTAQVWRDGWVHTGDVGHLDEQGYLRLTSRLKDMIIVVGGHVYPVEVEEALLGHPGIAEAAVYGVRAEDAAELVHAAVVPRPGHTLTEQEVREHVASQLGALYTPHHVEFLDRIPLTDAGKPDKKVLRARH